MSGIPHIANVQCNEGLFALLLLSLCAIYRIVSKIIEALDDGMFLPWASEPGSTALNSFLIKLHRTREGAVSAHARFDP